jgi:hypothetical protein
MTGNTKLTYQLEPTLAARQDTHSPNVRTWSEKSGRTERLRLFILRKFQSIEFISLGPSGKAGRLKLSSQKDLLDLKTFICCQIYFFEVKKKFSKSRKGFNDLKKFIW